MDNFTSNMDAIEFGRQKIKELPELNKEELENLLREVKEWCHKNKYTILNASAKNLETDLIPDIEKRLNSL